MSAKAYYQAQIDLYYGYLTEASDRLKKLTEARKTLKEVSTKITFELDGGAEDIKITYKIAGDKYDEHLENEKEVIKTAKAAFKKLKQDTIAELDDEIYLLKMRIIDYSTIIGELKRLKASAEG